MKKQHLSILVILIAGLAIAYSIIKSAPKPQKKIEKEIEPLVEVTDFKPATEPPYWRGGATVNANDYVQLVAQVTGQLEWVNPDIKPGMFVEKGTLLAQIEDADYQLQLQQKQAASIQAQANLDIELGQVENARSDYRLSGIELNPVAKSLALREPQLSSAKAALKMAKADLAKAKLNLQRTQIKMPFDGHVLQQMAFTGSYLNNTNAVFTIIDSSFFWVEVSVPNHFLSILDISASAQVRSLTSDASRQARILSISPSVDANDRQARVLLEIPKPLDTSNGQPLIRYNDYIEVTLYGKQQANLFRLASDKVDTAVVWAVDKNNQLKSIPFSLVFKGREYSWVKFDGEQINSYRQLISELSDKQDGLKVRVQSVDGAQ
ncbi:efflux RND transporter periplasmic adaptor subunit [Bermanella marisrubri]|uniref:Efflux transporter, RND family, MFP subunit subfamily protein n=1 Tax=Bermanella marisrubri TaxID=207949 RepID=Q1N2F4_9GAMM|nr:efflux RND transporter periplasmic adaptor subunit [Bermanella marisrubri]EAT12453.1 efflux transporter, RND family, MFP subunit subfamily protein [Oceanobacter sp. RED65] [Bermanella marisrubri]QIZ85531.1 efflux RND transporter periplasmic adaptor subunit [Bermanella marisrubri]